MTEGRRSFLDRYAGIESGRECERWAPTLSAIADGEASSEDLVAVRPHLRNCPGCRAALRDFRAAPSALASLVPVAGLALGGGSGPHSQGALLRLYEAVVGGASDRLTLSAHRLQAGLEAASSAKLAAVAVSATALGGGAVAIDAPSLTSGNGANGAHQRESIRHHRPANRGVRASQLVSQTATDGGVQALAESQSPSAQSPASSGAAPTSTQAAPAPAPASEFDTEASPADPSSPSSSASGPSAAAPARASPAGPSASSGGGGEFGP